MLDRAETSNTTKVRGLLKYGDLVLDLGRCSLSCGGKSVALGLAESLVLLLLIQNGKETTYYSVLLEGLSPVPVRSESRMPILRAAVFALRNRLRMIGARTIIQVSTRTGYNLAPPTPHMDRLRVAFDTTFGRL